MKFYSETVSEVFFILSFDGYIFFVVWMFLTIGSAFIYAALYSVYNLLYFCLNNIYFPRESLFLYHVGPLFCLSNLLITISSHTWHAS